MTDLDVKISLEKYGKYYSKIEEIKTQIIEVNARRFHTGSGVGKMPSGGMAIKSDEQKFKNMDLHDELQADLSRYLKQIALALEFIQWCEPEHQRMIEDKYIEKKSGAELEKTHGYSCRQIRNIIDEDIPKFIEWRRHKRNA